MKGNSISGAHLTCNWNRYVVTFPLDEGGDVKGEAQKRDHQEGSVDRWDLQ